MVVDDRPGRFRYDRESEEDDDDDFHFVLLSQTRKSSSENSDADENDENLKCSDNSYESKQQYQQTSEHVEITTTSTTSTGSKIDLYEFNNLHRTNYEAYRNECSRLMANETYEPALAPVVAVDLRRLLRDKAMSHHYNRQNQTSVSIEPQQNNHETPTNYSSGTAGDDNNHEFEYEPIERDIDVLQRPYRRFYLSKRPPFYSSCHNRGGGCGSRSTGAAAYSKRSKPNGNYPNDDNLINYHNNTEDDHDDKDNNYDDERSHKKLKSVVVVKVNYTNSSN